MRNFARVFFGLHFQITSATMNITSQNGKRKEVEVMQNKLNYRRTFFIGLAFLSISAFWQMYDNIVPLIMQETFGLGETVTV